MRLLFGIVWVLFVSFTLHRCAESSHRGHSKPCIVDQAALDVRLVYRLDLCERKRGQRRNSACDANARWPPTVFGSFWKRTWPDAICGRSMMARVREAPIAREVRKVSLRFGETSQDARTVGLMTSSDNLRTTLCRPKRQRVGSRVVSGEGFVAHWSGARCSISSASSSERFELCPLISTTWRTNFIARSRS